MGCGHSLALMRHQVQTVTIQADRGKPVSSGVIARLIGMATTCKQAVCAIGTGTGVQMSEPLSRRYNRTDHRKGGGGYLYRT